MSLVFSNQGGSTLAVAINDSATVVRVVDSSSFPDLTGEQTFYLVLEDIDRTYFEVTLATAINKTTHEITVTRAQGGTSAVAFNAGAFAENRLTKTTLEVLIQSLQESGTGSIIDNILRVSQAEYDGLTPDPTTLYMIPGSGGGGGGGMQSFQRFNSSGTWTKPSGLTYALVWVQGGGGAGGGCNSSTTTTAAAGSGGGGGGFAASFFAAGDLGATETVTVASEVEGSEDDDGSDGETSSFGTHITANGGSGGKNGVRSTGFNAISGGNGGGSSVTSDNDQMFSTQGSGGHPGMSQGAALSNGWAVSGNGGNSFMGGGGAGWQAIGNDFAQTGSGGGEYGGGGSGALAVGALGSDAGEGASGAAGLVIVWEYY